MKPVKLGIAGVSGGGALHVAAAEHLAAEGLVDVVAFADSDHESPGALALRRAHARGYATLDDMLDNETELGAVCIAGAPHTHFPLAATALQRGIHVFLEKPPALRIQDLWKLLELEEANDCFCAVAFDEVARPAAITLKRRLCQGALGPIRTVQAHARLAVGDSYYQRAPWAGKAFVDSAFVLDGPLANSCIEVLNMAAYLSSPEPYEFARPAWVEAELYRAAPDIEVEDTACLRARMDSGVECCIHVTQAAAENHSRCWTVAGDHGVARYHDEHGVDLPGEHIDHTAPEQPRTTLLRRFIEVVEASDEPLLMPLAEAEGALLLMNGAYESSGRVVPVPRDHVVDVRTNGDNAWTVPLLDTIVRDAATTGRLLSQCDLPWAVRSERFSLEGYSAFPQRWER